MSIPCLGGPRFLCGFRPCCGLCCSRPCPCLPCLSAARPGRCRAGSFLLARLRLGCGPLLPVLGWVRRGPPRQTLPLYPFACLCLPLSTGVPHGRHELDEMGAGHGPHLEVLVDLLEDQLLLRGDPADRLIGPRLPALGLSPCRVHCLSGLQLLASLLPHDPRVCQVGIPCLEHCQRRFPLFRHCIPLPVPMVDPGKG